MHMCCSKGVFVCWHLNGDIMHQGCARLIRIGQDETVEWVLLKVRNSYHDNLERMCVTKWAVQLSAEIALPDWVTDTVREICIYETIKTHWHQGFNRVAWNIVRDIDGGDFEYHGEKTIRIAHICSLIAKMVLYLTSLANEDARIKEQTRYRKETGDSLAAACVRAGSRQDMTIERLEGFLAGTEAKSTPSFCQSSPEKSPTSRRTRTPTTKSPAALVEVDVNVSKLSLKRL
ncbi:hypothetical protein EDB80DRAFT_727551 [Ilyonectria destructans]|nr:hypothetical protein EDB80DRAFT_727551 [Ilyonectria destructans]